MISFVRLIGALCLLAVVGTIAVILALASLAVVVLVARWFWFAFGG